MDLPTEDIILKQRRINSIKKQIEYKKTYLKDPIVFKNHKEKQLLYKQINIYEEPKRKPKPIHMQHQKVWYDKQRDGRKNPYLRSKVGEFIISFD
mgnify:CR=1 FL=1|tara:strand:- start:473 stop:757 length:285 start_codon:yes stop_codon:yes gene_type:complete